jgi:hypothetical protein
MSNRIPYISSNNIINPPNPRPAGGFIHISSNSASFRHDSVLCCKPSFSFLKCFDYTKLWQICLLWLLQHILACRSCSFPTYNSLTFSFIIFIYVLTQGFPSFSTCGPHTTLLCRWLAKNSDIKIIYIINYVINFEYKFLNIYTSP